MWALVHVLVVPIPIHLPASEPEKSAKGSPSVWATDTHFKRPSPFEISPMVISISVLFVSMYFHLLGV